MIVALLTADIAFWFGLLITLTRRLPVQTLRPYWITLGVIVIYHCAVMTVIVIA